MSIRDLSIPTPKALNDCYFNRVFIGSTGSTGAFVATDKVQVNSTNGSNFGYMQDTPAGQFKLQAGGPTPQTSINPDGGQMILGASAPYGSQYNLNVNGDAAFNGAIYAGITGTSGSVWLAGSTAHGLYRTPTTNNINLKTTGGAVYIDTLGDGNTNFRVNQVGVSASRPLYMNNPTAGLGCFADMNDPSNRFVAGVGGTNGNGVANSAFLGTYTNSDLYMYRNGAQSIKLNAVNDVEVTNGLQIGNSASTTPGTLTYGAGAINIQNAGGKYPLTNPINLNNSAGVQLKVYLQYILLTRVAGVFELTYYTPDTGFNAPTISSQTPITIDLAPTSLTNIYNFTANMIYTNAAASAFSYNAFFVNTAPYQMRITNSNPVNAGVALNTADFTNGDVLRFYVMIIGN